MKITVTHEFEEDNREDYYILLHASLYHSTLWELDQEIRSKLKYGQEEWLEGDAFEYLEKLREMIHDSGALRDG